MLANNQWYQKLWILLLLGLMVIHLGRPHELFSVLQIFKPFSLLAASITLLMIFGGTNLLQLRHTQMTLFWVIMLWFVALTPFAYGKSDAIGMLQQMMLYVPFMISVIVLIITPERMKLLIQVLVGCATFVGLQAIFLNEGGRNGLYNMGAFLGDPNDLSIYSNMILPFSYALFLNERFFNWKKLMYLVITLMLVWVVVNTFSRGGFLGLIATAGIMWLYGPYKKQILAAFFTGAIIVGVVAGPSWIETISTATTTESTTAQTRITAWKASLELFKHYPMGAGINNIPSQMYKFIEHSADRPVDHYHGDVSHSLWLTWLVEGGLVGFGLFIALLVVNFRQSLALIRIVPTSYDSRFMKLFGIACVASLTAFCVSGTFLTVNYYPHIWYLSAIIASGYNIVRKRNAV